MPVDCNGLRCHRPTAGWSLALCGVVIALAAPAWAGKRRAAPEPGTVADATVSKKTRSAGGAKPAESKSRCADLYGKAEEQSRAGHLREAKQSLAGCAHESCSAAIRKECTRRFSEVDLVIPSVVPLVTDDQGEPVVLVEVHVDGQLLTSKLDGQALPIDPGTHEFAFSDDRGIFATEKVLVVQGQRNRPLSVRLKRGAGPSRIAPRAALP